MWITMKKWAWIYLKHNLIKEFKTVHFHNNKQMLNAAMQPICKKEANSNINTRL